VKRENEAIKIRVWVARNELKAMRTAFNRWYCNDGKIVAKYAQKKGMKMISERQKCMVRVLSDIKR
jgi:hypothetical protein